MRPAGAELSLSAAPEALMIVVGIDLSGPANDAATAVVAFQGQGDRLVVSEVVAGADDLVIEARFRKWAANADVVAGIDAPLSYNVGGGDRPGDARLRTAIIAAGLRPGTVMAPTLNRMVYLTLRGVAISRMLQTLKPRVPAIVEVHPSATMALRGGPAQHVIRFKQDENARGQLLHWLESQGLEGVAAVDVPSDHYVAACASALAAWKWSAGQPVWVERATLPIHPFDFAC
jgi:predicted nuclease with RNAse H fold